MVEANADKTLGAGSSPAKLTNITYDELVVGQTAWLKRTLTINDIALFATVSGDVNPAHLDAVYARDDIFHGIIGHGMWTGALVSNLLGTQLPGPGTIYLSQDLRFKRPVRLGDEITVKITVKEKPADKKQVVVFDCIGLNQRGETVIDGVATVMAPLEKLSLDRPVLPEIEIHNHDGLAAVLRRAQNLEAVRTAVVHPVKANVIEAVWDAVHERLISPILIGPKAKILKAAEEADIDIAAWEIIDTEHSHQAAAVAAEMAAAGKVDAIMKGSLHSDELMAAIVCSSSGLRTARRISHAFVMDVPSYPKPFIITDAAINIAPDLHAKADITQNAINLWHVIFGDEILPKVAVLAAVETVSADMPATLDAAALCKMADRGQITGAIIDGPLAFDNAISPEAAREKGIVSDVAGHADILLVPEIEAGNMLAKQLSFLGHADAAGIVLGARVPVILTSRADNLRARLLSCALAVLLSDARKQGQIK